MLRKHVQCLSYSEKNDLTLTPKAGERTYHLKECQVGVAHVVKGYLGVDPGVVLGGALPLVVHNAGQQSLTVPAQQRLNMEVDLRSLFGLHIT